MKLESTIAERAGFLYITPLFDSVLLVLVFFIFSSNIVSKSGVAVALPTSNSIVKDSKATQSEKSVANQVTILADEGSSYGAVMEVALIALRYNFEVAFGTQPDQR